MANEIEAAAVLSLGGFFRRSKAEVLPPGSPCPNCGTPLHGRWCHACGQLGEDFHRSALKLLGESVREFLNVDNRIWRTLPALIFRPGRLTRNYLDGHRASQIPPLRLFLVALVILFLVGQLTPSGHHQNLVPQSRSQSIQQIGENRDIEPADRNSIVERFQHAKFDLGKRNNGAAAWLTDRVKYAFAHPHEFWQAVQNWSERFAILMLPLSATLLGVLFVFKRNVFFFDHIIFSMHSLSFLCLLLAAIFLSRDFAAASLGGWLLVAAPVHLFAHMRGVYRSTISGTLIRMFLLFLGSAVGLVLIVLGLAWVALAEM